MRKCVIMFAVWVIVLVLASLVTESDENLNTNEVVVALDSKEQSGDRP